MEKVKINKKIILLSITIGIFLSLSYRYRKLNKKYVVKNCHEIHDKLSEDNVSIKKILSDRQGNENESVKIKLKSEFKQYIKLEDIKKAISDINKKRTTEETMIGIMEQDKEYTSKYMCYNDIYCNYISI